MGGSNIFYIRLKCSFTGVEIVYARLKCISTGVKLFYYIYCSFQQRFRSHFSFLALKLWSVVWLPSIQRLLLAIYDHVLHNGKDKYL